MNTLNLHTTAHDRAAAGIFMLLMATPIGRKPSKALDQELKGIRKAAEAIAHNMKWELPEEDRGAFVIEFLQKCGLYA